MLTTRQKLDKCKASIEAHIARGGSRNSARGLVLEARYDNLRLVALENGEWRQYCEAHDMCFSHRGFDLFA